MSAWREIRLPDGGHVRYTPDDHAPGGYRVQLLVSGEWRAIHGPVSLILFGAGFRAGLQSAVSDGVQGSLL